jgi:hypothetical protein
MRVVILCAVGVGLAAGTSACDPAPPPDNPEEASVTVEIGSAGKGRVTVEASEEHLADLKTMATVVGQTLFPELDRRVLVDTRYGGVEQEVVEVADLYRPGANPTIQVSTQGLAESLEVYGIRKIEFAVCPPARIDATLRASPPVEIGGCATASLALDGPPVTVLATLLLGSANPWPLIIPMLLSMMSLLIAAASLWLKWRTRFLPRRLAVAWALVAGALGLIALQFVSRGDDPALSVRYSGWIVTLARIGPGVAIAEIILAVCLIGLAYVALQRTGTSARRQGRTWHDPSPGERPLDLA